VEPDAVFPPREALRSPLPTKLWLKPTLLPDAAVEEEVLNEPELSIIFLTRYSFPLTDWPMRLLPEAGSCS